MSKSILLMIKTEIGENMKENKQYKNIAIKAVSVLYMAALTIVISYNITKLQYTELWENERIAMTALVTMAFAVSLIYFAVKEKNIILMMVMYHVVLLGALAYVAIPVEYMPFLMLPVLAATVYDIRAGLVVNITVSAVLFVGYLYHPLYYIAVLFIIIGSFGCFAVYKSGKKYESIAGIVAALVVEFICAQFFAYYCEGTGYIYEKNSFKLYMIYMGVLSILVANVAGMLLKWAFKKETPVMVLRRISSDSHIAVRTMKNKSTSLYYHSTEVAELARVAARRIGANEDLAYAGGIYHDLGKIAGAEYIKEGLVLADKYKLPQSVKDIMVEHNVKVKLPRTKEAAIVMMCDTAISAVEYLRGTMDKKDVSEKAIIENALNKRINSGTLGKSGLTIEEFDNIKEVLIKIKEKQ